MRCDPRFKWLSVVTIYVVCIVCLLDACPPSSMLDHNTCASNPEQANSQVKNTVCNRPTTILSNILCNDTRRFLFDCHFIIFRFYFFTISFFSSFISLLSIFTLRFILRSVYRGHLVPWPARSLDSRAHRVVAGGHIVYTSLAVIAYQTIQRLEQNIHWRTSLTSDTITHSPCYYNLRPVNVVRY